MKIGILGAGKISSWFLNDLTFNRYQKDIKVTGIFDLDANKAQQYATEYKITKVLKTLDEFWKQDFDLVYIGTPDQSHYDLTKTALKHHFNVYCEKPFSTNYEKAKKLYALAKQKQLLLIDGIKTGFSPAYRALKQDIKNGLIGNLVLIHATRSKVSTSLKIPEPGPEIKTNGYQFGEAMYPLFTVLDLAGPIASYEYLANSYEHNKAIATSAFLIRHHNNTISTVIGSDHTSDNLQTVIQGTKGYILLGGNLNKYNQNYQKDSSHMAHTYEVRDLANQVVKKFDDPFVTKGEGLFLVLEHVYELWKNNQITSPIMTPELSLAIIRFLSATNKAK